MDNFIWFLLISIFSYGCASPYVGAYTRPYSNAYSGAYTRSYNSVNADAYRPYTSTNADAYARPYSANAGAYSRPYANVNAQNELVVEQRRTPPPAYTNDFLNEYEPYAYAAIPIHSPMPLIHVVSPSNAPKYRPKKYVRPKVQQEQYVHSSSAEESSEYSPEEYSDSITRPKYASYYEDDIPVLVYGRTNKKGHRKPSTIASPSTSLVHSPHEPFVIRIHKYRLIKD